MRDFTWDRHEAGYIEPVTEAHADLRPIPWLIRLLWLPGFVWFVIAVSYTWSHSYLPGADPIILAGFEAWMACVAAWGFASMAWLHRHNPAAYRRVKVAVAVGSAIYLTARVTDSAIRHYTDHEG